MTSLWDPARSLKWSAPKGLGTEGIGYRIEVLENPDAYPDGWVVQASPHRLPNPNPELIVVAVLSAPSSDD
jgi:hypothetical protein